MSNPPTDAPVPLVFWQPFLSVHQMPLLEALTAASSHPCYLVTDRDAAPSRQKCGWEAEAPANATHLRLSEGLDGVPTAALHIISGYRGTRAWRAWRRRILADPAAQVVVMTEGTWAYGRAPIRLARFARLGLARFSLGRQLKAVLAIGQRAQRQAHWLGVKRERIYPFLYVTDTPGEAPQSDFSSERAQSSASGQTDERSHDSRPTVVYIGTRRQVKNTGSLVAATAGIARLVMVGAKAPDCKDGAESQPHVHLPGTVPNREIGSYLRTADCLALPSWHDGWGAVVNEALMCGTPVLCSSRAGAAELLRGQRPSRGVVVDTPTEEALRQGLQQILEHSYSREEIRAWARQALDAQVIAAYLDAVIQHIISDNSTQAPHPPWLRDGSWP